MSAIFSLSLKSQDIVLVCLSGLKRPLLFRLILDDPFGSPTLWRGGMLCVQSKHIKFGEVSEIAHPSFMSEFSMVVLISILF